MGNQDKKQYNIKYKTDFMCTYNLIEDYNDSFVLYQVQLLQSFNTRIFDDEKINYITEQLYEKYKSNKYIINLINRTNFDNNEVFGEFELTKFRSYFGYDTFYIFHNLLRSLIHNNNINQENYNLLLEN